MAAAKKKANAAAAKTKSEAEAAAKQEAATSGHTATAASHEVAVQIVCVVRSPGGLRVGVSACLRLHVRMHACVRG